MEYDVYPLYRQLEDTVSNAVSTQIRKRLSSMANKCTKELNNYERESCMPFPYNYPPNTDMWTTNISDYVYESIVDGSGRIHYRVSCKNLQPNIPVIDLGYYVKFNRTKKGELHRHEYPIYLNCTMYNLAAMRLSRRDNFMVYPKNEFIFWYIADDGRLTKRIRHIFRGPKKEKYSRDVHWIIQEIFGYHTLRREMREDDI